MQRTTLLIGEEGIEKLQKSHVLVAGLGGVGSYATEFLARAGIGKLTLIDGDIVDPSNRNRQLIALSSTHGKLKAELMRDRVLHINPEIEVKIYREFMTPEMAHTIIQACSYDFVLDAIDSISPKISFLVSALQGGMRVISSMGAGGKMDPLKLKIADISQTHTCPFAQYVRKRLREKGIYEGLQVVFSDEKVIKESLMLTDGKNYKKSAYGTISYLSAAFGGVCSSLVIRELCK